MKVFIADFDLFAKVGGGQTFYRSLIAKNPQIDFYYLIENESPDNVRPGNAQAIPYQETYLIQDFASFFDTEPPRWTHHLFVKASNIAASLQGMAFDIVDVPDYEQWGLFLAPALHHQGITYGKLALSMHGVISTTLRLDWFQENAENLPLKTQEKKQYEICDVRYGISRSYLEEWQNYSEAPNHYYHPFHFLDLPVPAMIKGEGSNLPDLNFVGRTEKRKGPDIFIELAWWLAHYPYRQANLIGPHSFNPDRTVSSESYLRSMLGNRLEKVQFLPAQSQQELFTRFQTHSITFVPSRYDTLNLVALESLFAGCPTAIGSGAGVCRLLADDFPQIRFVKVDIENIYRAIAPLGEILENYSAYRQQLVTAVQETKFIPPSPTITEIYQAEPTGLADVQGEVENWYRQLMAFWQKRQQTFSLAHNLALQIKPLAKPLYHQLKSKVGALKAKGFEQAKDAYTGQLIRLPFLTQAYRRIFDQPEQTAREVDQKLEMLWRIGSDYKKELLGVRGKLAINYRVDRVRLWRELARIEEIRGNTLITATYKLRAMRALGEDRFGDLPGVVKILQTQGFPQEAQAIQVMYGGLLEERDRKCYELIEQSRLNCLKNPADDQYEIWDDRRQKNEYRATIIVSLYKAEQKLQYFLETLQHQTLIKRGEAEVILVDSGSPTDEYRVFKDIAPTLGYDLLYVRSWQRETIQSAWNRGISLAHSPYLAFLGVDETILPDCLEILAQELDQDPALDWVIGHSLVTNVDAQGSWINDIMPYDRSGYEQDLVYLETCYLSWVGALYRKSIHDRFGYYDQSFRGAGDTEFKNRVMPFINSKIVDKTLGLFWNYPDDRTTQSPNIEIEDMRAWYLHRTFAGVQYAFQGRTPEEVENLIYHCLGYRKSYCQHTSTDFDHAHNLAQYLQHVHPQSPALQFFPGIQTALQCYRAIDYLPDLASTTPVKLMLDCRQRLHQIEQEHRQYWPSERNPSHLPTYKIFNDNRHEQHAFLWFSNIGESTL